MDRRRRVNDIVAQVVSPAGRGLELRTRLGHALFRPLTGIPVLAVTLYLMYEVIGVFVAGTVVGLHGGNAHARLRGALPPERHPCSVTGHSGVAYEILAGEFGVITMTVTYVFGLLLPLVIAFYLLLSTLEDSGYLPRIAALSDRLMTTIGLNGRAIIPLILGFGCITMATITTRILGNERERRIATALMAFAIPCSAQLGVIVALLAAAGGVVIALAYGAIMVLVFGLIGLAMSHFLPGTSTDLLIDLPPLRVPRPRNVLTKTYHKTRDVHAGGSALLRRRRAAPQHPADDRRPAGPADASDAAHRRLAAPAGATSPRLRHGLRAPRLRRRRPLRPGPQERRRSWSPWSPSRCSCPASPPCWSS